jgi:pimeloyl-ACP methyl ester carboxylesterase
VILESGIAASSPSWRLVEPEIARFARVVTYDRAGLGWSDLGRIPVTPEQILSDLRAALEGAGERPPYIFVGHSFGGLIAQIFAARHRGELAGMVLLDPPHWSEWHPDGPWQNQVILRHGARLSRRGAWCARLGVNRLLLTLLTAGFRRGPRAFVVAVSGRAITVANRIVGEVRKLPPETHAILKAIWSQPKCFESMATHLEALPAMCAEVARNSAPGALGNLPLVVITAGTPSPDRRRHQEEVAALSTHGQHIVAPQSGHWVQLDQPQLIVETVRHLMG